MDKILNFYKNDLGLKNPETVDYLASHSAIVNVKKRTTFIKNGELVNKFYFHYDGFCYVCRNKMGKRKDICYLFHGKGEPYLTGSKLEPYVSTADFYFTIDSSVIEINFEDLYYVLKKDPETMEVYNKILGNVIQFKNDFVYMRYLPPIQRVQYVFDRFSHLAPYLNNTEISWFLDMSRSEYIKTLKLIK